MKIISKTETQLIVEHSQQAPVRVAIIIAIVGLEAVIENLLKFHSVFSWVISWLIVFALVSSLPEEVVICDFDRKRERVTIAQKRLRTLLKTESTEYPLAEIVRLEVNTYKSDFFGRYEALEIVLASGERVNINFAEPGNKSYLKENYPKFAEDISEFLELKS